MKKIALTILMIIAVFWTCGVSSAKEKNTDGQESEHSEKLQKETKLKGKAAEKGSNIDKSKTDEVAGKGKAKAAKTAAVKGKGKADTKENVTAKGKEHQQQVMALDKQMVREKAKHLRSMARLKRIRELAVKKGDTKVVERVDKLMAKAQQINSGKQKRMQKRKQTILQLSKPKSGADMPKALRKSSDKGKAGDNKAAQTRQPKTGGNKAAQTRQPKTRVTSEDEKVKEKPVRPQVKPGGQKGKPKGQKKGR